MRSSLLITTLYAAALATVVALPAATPALALTMKECGDKYQAAKSANTLKGQTWNAFRKAECGDDDVSADEAAAVETAPPAKATKANATVKASGVVYPRGVSPSYSDLSAGKARMRTCVDQYNANKANGGNGDLKWIMKGGGYYSECNKRLKS